MEITWLGHACFKIKTGDKTIITDPFDASIGLKEPKGEADIVTVSHHHFDHANTKAITGSPTTLEGPGEYEIGGISITGVPAYHDKEKGLTRGRNTLFVFDAEGIRVCHLGDLGHKLSDEELEELDGVDILLVPVGGTYTIDGKEAAEVVAQIEPSIIIPMHYKIEKLNLDIADASKFTHEMGAKSEALDKLIIKAATLPEEGEKVVLLKPKL